MTSKPGRRDSYGVPTGPDQLPGTRDQPSKDQLFKVLGNQRRRNVLHYLERHGGRAELDELAEQIAAWETGPDTETVTSTERKRVYTALQQFHLPKLEDAGLVRYDERSGTVERADAAAEIDVYLDLVPENDIPWSQYYVGLSSLGLALTGLSALGLPVLSVLSPAAWATGFVAVTLISGLAHAYRDRQYRLGVGESPPETEFE